VRLGLPGTAQLRLEQAALILPFIGITDPEELTAIVRCGGVERSQSLVSI
jgi:hypothetical protein